MRILLSVSLHLSKWGVDGVLERQHIPFISCFNICRTRLGLPSSNIGLDALMGRLDDFSTESYLGLPETSIDMPDFRADIEKQRGIHVKRGI